MSHDLSGKLDIRLRRDGEGLQVSIRSSRPVTAARVFAGWPVADLVRRLPMLFSVCGTAQAHACTSACEQALGLHASANARRGRALVLRAETAKEHLWRLLLDWPAALDAAPAQAAMARALRGYRALRDARITAGDPFVPGADPAPIEIERQQAPLQELRAVAVETVFGMSPERWLEQARDGDGFAGWAAGAGTLAAALIRALLHADLADLGRNAVAPLPTAALADLPAALSGAAAEAFVAAPSWRGRAHETTPFARCRARAPVADLAAAYGNGLLPRLAALLLELADAMTAPGGEPAPATAAVAPLAAPADSGIGVGRADAARGLLVHRVAVADGRVTDYRILAPTEWNFHPHGVVAAGLAGDGLARLADATERKRRAALYITAVDPCVGYRLSVC